jgi:hypothetical protein
MKKFGGRAHDDLTRDPHHHLARRDFLQQAAAIGAGPTTKRPEAVTEDKIN